MNYMIFLGIGDSSLVFLGNCCHNFRPDHPYNNSPCFLVPESVPSSIFSNQMEVLLGRSSCVAGGFFGTAPTIAEIYLGGFLSLWGYPRNHLIPILDGDFRIFSYWYPHLWKPPMIIYMLSYFRGCWKVHRYIQNPTGGRT